MTDKDVLPDVGKHAAYGTGHYEARFMDDGCVEILTVFDSGKGPHTVHLSPQQWDRLTTWVEWRRKELLSRRHQNSPMPHTLPS